MYKPHGVAPAASSVQGNAGARLSDESWRNEADVEGLRAAPARREPAVHWSRALRLDSGIPW
ncbi:hypothetical protein, partial [Streptomyces sp. NPDC001089]